MWEPHGIYEDAGHCGPLSLRQWLWETHQDKMFFIYIYIYIYIYYIYSICIYVCVCVCVCVCKKKKDTWGSSKLIGPIHFVYSSVIWPFSMGSYGFSRTFHSFSYLQYMHFPCQLHFCGSYTREDAQKLLPISALVRHLTVWDTACRWQDNVNKELKDEQIKKPYQTNTPLNVSNMFLSLKSHLLLVQVNFKMEDVTFRGTQLSDANKTVTKHTHTRQCPFVCRLVGCFFVLSQLPSFQSAQFKVLACVH